MTYNVFGVPLNLALSIYLVATDHEEKCNQRTVNIHSLPPLVDNTANS